jgi:spermidine/putrescine-binding protein
MSLKRRDFLRQLTGVPLVTGALALSQLGCGRPVRRLQNGLEDRLHLYTWSDYVAPETLPRFTRETGVRVVHDTYESSEEMLARLLMGGVAYDVVVPPTYGVQAMRATGLLQPWDGARIATRNQIAPTFRGLPFDPEGNFALPYLWGLTGIAYRADKVTAPSSWASFLDPVLNGRVTMLDDMRDVIGAMLRLRGASINTTDAPALTQARGDALAAKRVLRGYKSAAVKSDLLAGDVWLAQLWNGDTRQAAAEDPRIRFVLPSEGSTLWLDSMVLLERARHPAAAHAFAAYILRPDVGAELAQATGYGTPNLGALQRVADPVPLPTADELARLEYQADLGRATERWDRIWTEIKAG